MEMALALELEPERALVLELVCLSCSSIAAVRAGTRLRMGQVLVLQGSGPGADSRAHSSSTAGARCCVGDALALPPTCGRG